MVCSGMSSTSASVKISWPPRCAASHLTLVRLNRNKPKLATLTLSTSILATELGVTERYVQKIRGGVIPHAGHFQKLAEIAGVKDEEKAIDRAS